MKCAFCNSVKTRVIDSRPSDDKKVIRRRRECSECEKRFTTYEKIETVPIFVIKRNNKGREVFKREKLIDGLLKACNKRPISINEIENIVDDVENTISNKFQREITTEEIGNLIMKRLKSIDEVAYIRFVSVYKKFKDIETFIDEIKLLQNKGM